MSARSYALIQRKPPTLPLTPSVLGYIYTTSFECDYMIFLTLKRVYGGQRVNSQTLYCFNSFLHDSLKVKVWGAYAVSARSCGRSSPVSLAFEPVVE